MSPETPRTARRDGCGFLLATIVFTCLFLVINGLVLTASYGFIAEVGPAFLQRDKVKQLVLFLGPVAMIFVQWTLIDWLALRLFGGVKN